MEEEEKKPETDMDSAPPVGNKRKRKETKGVETYTSKKRKVTGECDLRHQPGPDALHTGILPVRLFPFALRPRNHGVINLWIAAIRRNEFLLRNALAGHSRRREVRGRGWAVRGNESNGGR